MMNRILKEITAHYPCDIYEVKHIYSETKSLDKTIMILEFSVLSTIPTPDILESISND